MSMSVLSLFNLYIKHSVLADSSVALKKTAVTKFTDWFGDIDANEVTPERADSYRSNLVRHGTMTNSSANFYLANIGPFFAWSVAHGHIDRNPFEGVRRFVAERKARPIFTAEEVGRMLDVADARWQAIVRLSAQCSLRRAEIMNICKSDVAGRWLHVQAKRKTKATWQWRIKNHAEALVPINEPLREAFAQLAAEEVPPNQPYLLVVPKTYRRMMHLQAENSLSWDRRNCPYDNFTRWFKRLLKRAGVIPKRFQDLRGTFATALHQGGMGIEKISRLMRHSSVQTTHQFYLRYSKQELANESEQILEKYYGVCVP